MWCWCTRTEVQQSCEEVTEVWELRSLGLREIPQIHPAAHAHSK